LLSFHSGNSWRKVSIFDYLTGAEDSIMTTYTDKELIEVYSAVLHNVSWSACGNYIQGTSLVSGETVFIDVSHHITAQVTALGASNVSGPAPASVATAPVATPDHYNMEVATAGHTTDSKSTKISRMQTAGTPAFGVSSEGLIFSALSQDISRSSTIILRNVGPAGLVTTSDLMRLPKSTTLEKSYSTLIHTDDNKNLRLVLNMAAQDTYSTEEKEDFRLPAVFDRKTESIPFAEEVERTWPENLSILGKHNMAQTIVGSAKKRKAVDDVKREESDDDTAGWRDILANYGGERGTCEDTEIGIPGAIYRISD
jgi:hypothetical protein